MGSLQIWSLIVLLSSVLLYQTLAFYKIGREIRPQYGNKRVKTHLRQVLPESNIERLFRRQEGQISQGESDLLNQLIQVQQSLARQRGIIRVEKLLAAFKAQKQYEDRKRREVNEIKRNIATILNLMRRAKL